MCRFSIAGPFFWLKMIQTSCLTIASLFYFISFQKPCPSNQICDILVQNPSRSLTVETFDPEPNHPDNQWIKLPSHVHKIIRNSDFALLLQSGQSKYCTFENAHITKLDGSYSWGPHCYWVSPKNVCLAQICIFIRKKMWPRSSFWCGIV